MARRLCLLSLLLVLAPGCATLGPAAEHAARLLVASHDPAVSRPPPPPPDPQTPPR